MTKYEKLQRRFNNQHNSSAQDESAIQLTPEQILETLDNGEQKTEREAMGGHILNAARAHLRGEDSRYYGSTVEAYFKRK